MADPRLRRLRIWRGAAKEIGWMIAGFAAAAAAAALVIGIVDYAQNASTSTRVDEVQRSVVRVSVCANHPHSKLCLKGITRAVRTCLEDPTCHALLATGIRGAVNQPEALRHVAEAISPVLEASHGGKIEVGTAPSSPEPSHGSGPHKSPPPKKGGGVFPNPPVETGSPPPTLPGNTTPETPAEMEGETGQVETKESPPARAINPILPAVGELACSINVLGVRVCHQPEQPDG